MSFNPRLGIENAHFFIFYKQSINRDWFCPVYKNLNTFDSSDIKVPKLNNHVT